MLTKSLARQCKWLATPKMSTLNSPAILANCASELKTYKDIPGPKTLPLLGSLFNLKSFGGDYDFLEFRTFQNRLQADFGDVVKWEVFNHKFVYLFNPEHIKEVYKADNSTPLRPKADPMVKLHQRIGLKQDLINR